MKKRYNLKDGPEVKVIPRILANAYTDLWSEVLDSIRKRVAQKASRRAA
jgi:hypothetical protein